MVKSCECAVSWHVYCIAATCFMTCCNVCLKIMRLTKKALLLLRLTEKYSFTLSKLRFFGLRKPKNSSFYPTSLQTWVTHFTFGSPTCINQENLFLLLDWSNPELVCHLLFGNTVFWHCTYIVSARCVADTA